MPVPRSSHPVELALCHRRGLTLIETGISLGLIAVLLSILLPALSSARVSSYRDLCQSNQRRIGQALETYLEEHQRQFPFVPVRPGWLYAGMRFSQNEGVAFPDLDRPLTPYLGLHRTTNTDEVVCCCPADRGISDPFAERTGLSRRTAFRSFGTSYRANAPLLDARMSGVTSEARGMNRTEVTTTPSRLIVLGDAIWHEVAESTGRHADWHHQADSGNLLFLDGSVRFMTIKPRTDRNQAILFDPVRAGMEPPPRDTDARESVRE